MNRRERRALRRRMVAALRDSGCTCSAEFTPDQTVDTGVPGAQESGTVRHWLGCPLGDSMIVANLAGHRPMIVVTGLPRCER